MKITLPREPRDLRGRTFPSITRIELTDFDVDLLLPFLYFKILALGRPRGTARTNQVTDIDGFLDRLARHPALQSSFDTTDGRRLLARMVPTALASIIRSGQGRRGPLQIAGLTPYSALCGKAPLGLSSRQRNVDTFVYEALKVQTGDEYQLRDFFTRMAGHGVSFQLGNLVDGRYDGQTPLDTLTRLSLAFLDGFQGTPLALQRTQARTAEEACPALVQALGRDLTTYLDTYSQRMPPQAFTYHLLALINFEMFAYTLKLVHAINTLVREPAALPPAMASPLAPSGPDLYIDFTGIPGHLSQRMASDGVRRDLNAYTEFLTSSLTLRQLDRYVQRLQQNARWRDAVNDLASLKSSDAPGYLHGLLLLVDNPRLADQIDARAEAEEASIRQASGEDDDPAVTADLDALLPSYLNPLERVVTLLVEAQKQSLHGLGRWFWSTGGLTKPHGLLAGALKGRRTAWRYQPNNDLLAVLVQLAAIQPGPNGPEPGPRSMRLREFLGFLHERFGILVDRPPAPFEGAEPVAAARDNLTAMLRRLRQMGLFEDLSDDFTVQELRPPYGAPGARRDLEVSA